MAFEKVFQMTAMACSKINFLSPSRRFIIYQSSLRNFSQTLRALYATRDNESSTDPLPITEDNGNSSTNWELLAPEGYRFCLPGKIGIASLESQRNTMPIMKAMQGSLSVADSSTLHEIATSYPEVSQPSPTEAGEKTLECVAQDCPRVLFRDIQMIFPDLALSREYLTVVTLTQKTENDMTSWNEEIEAEREKLTDYFVLAAQEICGKLKSEGYWADFVDPSSGRPFYSSHSSTTLQETDEGFHYLGFQIVDMGCCKVISHRLWGSYAFVGTVFTNAPATDVTLRQILVQHEQKW